MTRVRSAIPHSWNISSWPSDVWPGSASKGNYLVRSHKDELIASGVLSRVGRDLIVLGDRYSRWLEKKATNVPGYVPPCNREASQQMDGPQ